MSGEVVVKKYPRVETLDQPLPRVAMPRAPRLQVPGGTMHVVARCNNREFYFSSVENIPPCSPGLLPHQSRRRSRHEDAMALKSTTHF